MSTALPPFHGERMQRYGEQMEAIASAEIATWPSGAPMAMWPRMQAITLEIIVRTIFGQAERERLARLRSRLRDELMTLLIAGHETTATSLAWAIERLLRTPGALERRRSGDDAYLVHRREDVYPRAARLRPERCLGAAFAQFEMKAVLRVLAREVRLSPARAGRR